jgi:hypothetical protein
MPSRYVSRYETTAPREGEGPGMAFAVGGNRPLGFLLGVVAAAIVGGGLAYVSSNVVVLPIVGAALTGWAVKHAIALGAGGGTPDRGVLGTLLMFSLVGATFGLMKYVEYRAVEARESSRVLEIFGPRPLEDPQGAMARLKDRDTDRDGRVVLAGDSTSVVVADEQARLEAARATGRPALDPYDVVLLAAVGRGGFAGHAQHWVQDGTSIRLTPKGKAFFVPGFGLVVLWVVELAVLAVAAFARIE